MILYGSTTSPFVRRIRIFTDAIPLEFIPMDIFSVADRKLLQAKNPTLKVPFLLDDELSIFDSRVIFRYISDKFELTGLSWRQENSLTLIDSVNDSLVNMFILANSDLDTSANNLFFKLQRQRTDTVLSELEKQCCNNDFNEWHYPSICLYCLIDWAMFREMVDFSCYPKLLAFHQAHQQRLDVIASDPRN